MEAGVDGLLRDKTRPPRAALGVDVVESVVALTLRSRLARSRTGRAGRWRRSSASVSVHAAHLARPRLAAASRRSFKLSNDPQFAEKLRDIVGLYVDPPAHAIVLSVDEKSQIQALDRTQPGLPLKKGRCGTMTHDYIRNGTTTLFAALNVLEGGVIGRCMQRHRHQEFIRFLNAVEAEVPAGKLVHAVVHEPTPPTSIQRLWRGWTAILAGCSTSPQPRRPGSTRSRGSSPNSPSGGSSAASSTPSSRSRPLSTASSPTPTPTRAPSTGPRPRQNHRRRQTRAPNVRFSPLESLRRSAVHRQQTLRHVACRGRTQIARRPTDVLCSSPKWPIWMRPRSSRVALGIASQRAAHHGRNQSTRRDGIDADALLRNLRRQPPHHAEIGAISPPNKRRPAECQ